MIFRIFFINIPQIPAQYLWSSNSTYINFIINKPIFIFLQEATFACLHIPMNKNKSVVQYINSNPPHMHTKFVTFDQKVLQFHPICLHEFNTFILKTWIQMNRSQNKIDKLKHPSSKPHGQYNLGDCIYATNISIKFIGFHLTHNTKGFFYNTMLQNVIFLGEKKNKTNLLLISSFWKKLATFMHSWSSTWFG